MKIHIDRTVFSKPFSLVASVTATKDFKPVLQNVKITAREDGILLQATDQECGIRVFVEECSVFETGEAILPTKHLKRILQESNEASFDLFSDNDKTIVKGKSSRFSLATQPVDEFPDVEDFACQDCHEIAVPVFQKLLERTVFAADRDNSKYALGGTLFEFVDDDVFSVSTDGRRLSHQVGKGKRIGDHKADLAILPVKALQQLLRCCTDSEEPVRMNVSSSRAIFRNGSTVFFSRLVEGRFPKWRNIIPTTEGRIQVDIPAGRLLSAVRQASIVTTDKAPGVLFRFGEGQLQLTASGAEVGDSSIETEIDYSGESVEIKLDPKFVIDFLNELEPEMSVLVFVTNDGPALFQTDDGFFYVVMPLA